MNPFDLHDELHPNLPDTIDESGLMCVEISFPDKTATEHVIHYSKPIEKKRINLKSILSAIFKV